MNVSKFKLKEFCIITEDNFLVNLSTGRVYELNTTARDFISLLQEGRDFEQACQEISRKYSIPLEQVRKDFLEFVNQLRELEIIDL
ncbi:hypothetical protein TEU_02960 [Thermococcus eurythermalis]|uniref:PqqD family protein n=1 Tax=Thermococcus eurythermalis TaxID=1505907 RepID=A0A097QSC0_9EURY|nr:PqqD family protein [Thermococcus eurythermalis]AIU69385.1 hypothetical protein TEU_02960 [Thermococcus eurythermalis]